jgi:hypothetical protein
MIAPTDLGQMADPRVRSARRSVGVERTIEKEYITGLP